MHWPIFPIYKEVSCRKAKFAYQLISPSSRSAFQDGWLDLQRSQTPLPPRILSAHNFQEQLNRTKILLSVKFIQSYEVGVGVLLCIFYS